MRLSLPIVASITLLVPGCTGDDAEPDSGSADEQGEGGSGSESGGALGN